MPFNGSGSTISSATDVFLSGPQNNQVLTYDSGTLKWTNATAPGGAGSIGTEVFFPPCQGQMMTQN